MPMARAAFSAATNAGVDSIEHGTFLDEAGAQRDEGPWHLFFGDARWRSAASRRLLGTGKLAPESEAKAQQTLVDLGQRPQPRLSDRREDRARHRQRRRAA